MLKKKKIIILTLVCLFLFNITAQAKMNLNQKISLNLKDIKLSDAFRALGDNAGLNVIVGSRVEGRANVKLNEIPFIKGINLLTKTHGLKYVIKDNTIVVDIPKNISSSFGNKETKVFKLNNADPMKIKRNLTSIVESKNIHTNQRMNALVITAYRDKFPEIAETIKELDENKKQINLQVRIEEVSTSSLKNLGIKWEFGNIKFNQNENAGDVLELGKTGQINFSSILNALEDKGEANLLANPQVSTLSGKNANIDIVDNIPIENGNADETQVEFKKVGIKLNITPKVLGDNRIEVDVKPEVSSLKGYSANGYPEISTRKVQTNIRVKNNRTIAIGGLVKKNKVQNNAKIPVAGDIPYIGKLFNQSKTDYEKQELIIFITPKIIDDNGSKVKMADTKSVIDQTKEINKKQNKLNETKNEIENQRELVKNKRKELEKAQQELEKAEKQVEEKKKKAEKVAKKAEVVNKKQQRVQEIKKALEKAGVKVEINEEVIENQVEKEETKEKVKENAENEENKEGKNKKQKTSEKGGNLFKSFLGLFSNILF